MVTIRFFLKKDQQSKNKTIPIYCRLAYKNKVTLISTQEKVKEEFWDSENDAPTRKFQSAQRLNNKLIKIKSELEEIIEKLSNAEKRITVERIKAEYQDRERPQVDFFEIAKQYLDTLIVYGTRKGVESIINKVKKFARTETLYFDQINYQFVRDFENYMKKILGNKQNTIGTAHKKIRRIFNEAIKLDIIDKKYYPYGRDGFTIKSEPTNKDFLSEDELSLVENLVIDNVRLTVYKNAFVFPANVGGLRPSDVLKLRWENFDGSHINIIMHKTKRKIRVKVNDIGLEIIEYQKNLNVEAKPKDLIFPILSTNNFGDHVALDKAISSAEARVNKALKQIAMLAKIKPISFGMARHTFGTIAILNDVQLPVLKNIMGHSSITQTMVYVKITGKDSDVEMEKMNKRRKAI